MENLSRSFTIGVLCNMKAIQRGDEWWITDMPNDCSDCGPYETKADAEDDLSGLRRFYKHHDEPGFITSEEKP